MLRLPWPEWGDTDVRLAMAAELHDRLVCDCGCGQWEADAHDPEKADLWQVDSTVCYVRRAIDAHIKEWEPASDVVLSVRLVENPAEAARNEYEALRARFGAQLGPGPVAQPHDEERHAGDDPTED